MLFGTLALAAITTPAQSSTQHTGPIQHIGHYLNTHKELLAADALSTAGIWADVLSSIHCQRVCPQCTEEGTKIFGPHPTQGEMISAGLVESGFVITGYHLLWHYAPHHPLIRHLIWAPTAYIAVSEAYAAKTNVDTAERYQQAQQRLVNGG
jgi:hypothetical protein